MIDCLWVMFLVGSLSYIVLSLRDMHNSVAKAWVKDECDKIDSLAENDKDKPEYKDEKMVWDGAKWVEKSLLEMKRIKEQRYLCMLGQKDEAVRYREWLKEQLRHL